TVRFPRFKRLRMDKNWKSALSVQEFMDLKANVEEEQKAKQFEVDNSRRKRVKRTTKKPLTVAGYDDIKIAEYQGPSGKLFDGLNFCAYKTSCMEAAVVLIGLYQLSCRSPLNR